MLQATPIDLVQEIQKAKALADKINAARDDMIKAYAGDYYRDDWKSADGKLIDNRFDEWLRMVLPQIVYDNPKVDVTSTRSGVNPMVPKAMKAAINWWAPQVNLIDVLTDVAYDAAFTFGVILTTHGPRPGNEPWRSSRSDEAMQGLPRVTRIDPKRWFCDHTIDKYDPATGQGRLAGHLFRADRDELLKDKRFNPDAVSRCATGEGQANWGGEKSDREEIYGYEVWVPEIQTPGKDGDHPDSHGTIFTIGLNQDHEATEDATWLRDPRPYIGPADGPYTLFGMGTMPGCPYPYSPFASSWDQVKRLNKAVESEELSAETFKKFIAFDAANEQAGEAVRKVKHGQIAPVRGLKDGEVKEMSVGGISPEQIEHTARRGEQVDRSLNLSETARGNINVDTSATAVADAASQRSARLASMKRLMVNGAKKVLRSAAWHLYTHTDATFHLPPDVAEGFVPRPSHLPDPGQAEEIAMQLGIGLLDARKILDHQPEVIYGGGPSDEVISEVVNPDDSVSYVVSPYVDGLRFEDFELEIEPYTMERVDEALLQRRAMQVFEMVTNSIQMIVAYPQLPWEDLFDMVGEPMNMPHLSQRALGKQFLSQLRSAGAGGGMNPAMAMGQGAAPGQPQPGPVMPQPRPGTDGADGMDGRIGEAVYGGGNLAQATRG